VKNEQAHFSHGKSQVDLLYDDSGCLIVFQYARTQAANFDMQVTNQTEKTNRLYAEKELKIAEIKNAALSTAANQ